MRILILADFHHDFWASSPQAQARLQAGLDATGRVDAAILAGDVSNKARVRWKRAAAALDAIVARKATYVFPGNHDYYGHRIDGEDRLEEAAAALGWTWAQKQALILGGARFLCATLWTDLRLGRSAPENGQMLASRMNDYRLIRVERGGYRKLRPEDTGRLHAAHLHWISQMLATPFDGPTALVTHHVPHPDALGLRGSLYDAAYASDLGGWMDVHAGPTPRFWFFGHAHHAHRVDRPGWRLRPHSLGYPEEGGDPRALLPGCVIDTATL